MKPNNCYWCGGTDITANGEYDTKQWHAECQDCGACGPTEITSPDGAFKTWNSLALRLKPGPKKVTIKRYVNVYPYNMPPGMEQVYFVPDIYETLADAQVHKNTLNNCLDTVEVEITFTDRRGCE